MKTRNIVKILSYIVYTIGTALVIILSAVWLLGTDEAVNPQTMLQFTWKELAFLWLAIGAVPMLAACAAVYAVNDMRRGVHSKWKILLLFLPGLVCAGFATYVLGVLAVGLWLR